MRIMFLILLLASSLILLACGREAQSKPVALWEGEETRIGAGYPFVVKYIEVDKEAPLFVFNPGMNTLARAAYGGEGTRKEDFLSYWLTKNGYNFLAISYPLVTEGAVFDKPYPEITVPAWGRGIAEITKEIIDEHELKGKTIVGVWSMAGKSVQPYAEAAAELEVDHDFHVALASTPPLLTASAMARPIIMHESGMIKTPEGAPRATRELQEISEYNDRVEPIISKELWISQYGGHTPSQLQGRGLRYDKKQNKITRDYWADMQDTKFFETNFPFVATITPSWNNDARHVLTDHATWNYFNANKVFYEYVGGGNGAQDLTREQLHKYRDISRGLAQRLTIDVEGNHFFFIGEKGAKATADAIVELEKRIADVKADLKAVRSSQK